MMIYPWHLYVMALLYVLAGIYHFLKPNLYMRIMPGYLPNHKMLVYLSGLVEIGLGIMICFEDYQKIGLYGIIAMLFVFLLVHFYMLSGEKASAGIPRWILILRIPLQFVLMFWAYSYINL